MFGMLVEASEPSTEGTEGIGVTKAGSKRRQLYLKGHRDVILGFSNREATGDLTRAT